MIDKTINNLINRGALFVINNSGGKDSQAMTAYIRRYVPLRQILVIHAHLPDVEWAGTWEHIIDTTKVLEVNKVVAVKTFFQMVEHRGMFPSPSYRQCTSDLKRSPIEKGIKHHLKARPEYKGLIVNCMGMRAEESSNRAKAKVFKKNTRNSIAKREWYDWLTIHDWLIEDVWRSIQEVQQQPHWAYREGMSRLSCVFCIMSSQKDLETAARLNPEVSSKYVALEKRIGHTIMMPRKGQAPRYLEQITGIAA